MKETIAPDAVKAVQPFSEAASGSTRGGETASERSPLILISRLCKDLQEQQIDYCHWKSNNALSRSLCGDNDLDLLVSRIDAGRFEAILAGLAFKRAVAPAGTELPGVSNFFGYDETTGRLVHVHTHYQLVLGHDRNKNFRLPIEKAYLASATRGGLLRVPAPEFEFIVFMVRMALKHLTWDAVLTGSGVLKTRELDELEYLQARIDAERVKQVLAEVLPYIEPDVLNSCVQAVKPGTSFVARISAGNRLVACLGAAARYPYMVDAALKIWRRVSGAARRRLFNREPKYKLESGGMFMAIVGGDGAGKSTAIEALSCWLSEYFTVSTFHLGKPPWSFTTTLIRGILKVGQSLGLYPAESSMQQALEGESFIAPGFPWMIREVCRARDRYLAYVKARRHSANGAFVLVDRFPLPQVKSMDGPQIARFLTLVRGKPQVTRPLCPQTAEGPAARCLRLEESYYSRIARPDVLIILRASPAAALERRTGEDPASIWERSAEVWNANWQGVDAHVVDANESKAEVLARLRTILWSQI